MTSATAGAVRKFRIAAIVVPENRKRSDKGLHELTTSIRGLGLLNPIILTQDRRLVAGLQPARCRRGKLSRIARARARRSGRAVAGDAG